VAAIEAGSESKGLDAIKKVRLIEFSEPEWIDLADDWVRWPGDRGKVREDQQ
jgi:hypothetical protein